MKAANIIVKVLVALAAVAGAVYVIATYGDKIVAWAKKMLGNCKCCECCEGECECTCECEEAAAEEAPAEEAAAEEAAAEEAPAAEAEVTEADFEN
jgi:nucleoid-associated protein YgaU